jgi:diguanylate cyclase
MGTAASPFLNPITDELEGVGPNKPTAEALLRRARQRRNIQGMIGISYVIDAIVLLLYAHAGTIPATIGPAFAICGLISVAGYILLSEIGVTERFRDHYCVTQQAIASMAIMLAFIYIAPEVGVMFLCTLFVVFNFSSLRSTPLQTAVVWTAMALGLAWLFLLTDKPIAMPHGTYLERFATMTVFILTIGRCMFLGIFSSTMRSRRTNAPCSIALIDLDWFKRINDTHGHPTGDEVLRTFAITVFANIRTIDRFGRYGGEEFLLVLPDTPGDTATCLLDRLRAIIADLDWSAFSPGMQVTVSAGVTTLRPDETADTFLARADGALYTAKARGRNRIASA